MAGRGICRGASAMVVRKAGAPQLDCGWGNGVATAHRLGRGTTAERDGAGTSARYAVGSPLKKSEMVRQWYSSSLVCVSTRSTSCSSGWARSHSATRSPRASRSRAMVALNTFTAEKGCIAVVYPGRARVAWVAGRRLPPPAARSASPREVEWTPASSALFAFVMRASAARRFSQRRWPASAPASPGDHIPRIGLVSRGRGAAMAPPRSFAVGYARRTSPDLT